MMSRSPRIASVAVVAVSSLRLNLAQVERLARALRVAEDKLIRDLVQALGGP